MRHGGRGGVPTGGHGLLAGKLLQLCCVSPDPRLQRQGTSKAASAHRLRSRGPREPREARGLPSACTKLAPHWKGPCWGTSGRQAQSCRRLALGLLPRAPGGSLPRQPWTWPTMWTHGAPSVEGRSLPRAVTRRGSAPGWRSLCSHHSWQEVGSAPRPGEQTRPRGHRRGRRAEPAAGPGPTAEERAPKGRRGWGSRRCPAPTRTAGNGQVERRAGATGLGHQECHPQSLVPRGPQGALGPDFQVACSTAACIRTSHLHTTARRVWFQGLSSTIAKQGLSP